MIRLGIALGVCLGVMFALSRVEKPPWPGAATADRAPVGSRSELPAPVVWAPLAERLEELVAPHPVSPPGARPDPDPASAPASAAPATEWRDDPAAAAQGELSSSAGVSSAAGALDGAPAAEPEASTATRAVAASAAQLDASSARVRRLLDVYSRLELER